MKNVLIASTARDHRQEQLNSNRYKRCHPYFPQLKYGPHKFCTRELQPGCTTLLYRLLALDSVDVKFVRNPLLWLFKNPVDFINSYGYDWPWNSHHHCRSVRACTDAHRPWTPRTLPQPPDRTQGYHEPP
ncbi:hypothetical protein J6590_075839 [Homalodisca vitripennis]|nr:hypothetical protein J6590_075839 [Homalodisca vitripennis]